MTKNYLWIFAGYVMKLVGLVGKLQHVYHLGHYLTRSGKEVTRLFPSSLKSMLIIIKHDTQPHNDGNWHITSSGLLEDCVDLYKSIGKFRYKIEGNIVTIEDTYIFYACCKRVYNHFHDCGCPDSERDWADTNQKYMLIKKMPFEIPQKVREFVYEHPIKLGDCSKDIPYRERAVFKIGLELWAKQVTLVVHTSDKFWADKGKPFQTKVSFEVPLLDPLPPYDTPF